MTDLARASGILLHPSSLPSRGGIGDFGPSAYEFLDFLFSARQSLWQILPLGPLGYGNSPYSSISAFAGNPLLVSMERLVENGWIDRGRISVLPETVGAIDYDHVRATKTPLLREAARNFLATAQGSARGRYESFCTDNSWWLDDYALFVNLREQYADRVWNAWPNGLSRRDPSALDSAREQYREEIEIAKAIQFAFWEQWRALHHAAKERGIRIIGDVAIFVSYDSADVWTNPEIFRLNHNLDTEVVAGVPPDAFSATGQRWGNPLYRWDVLKQRGYDWWIRRMKWALETCDLVRLDHFRGFESYWEIPSNEPTAVNGRWVKGPNDDFFYALRNALGGFPFIAEDLGMITQEVHELRRRLNIPGMKVLQFGFGNPGAHIYLPHRCEPNSVMYTGTHDNDTTLGWFQCIEGEEKQFVESYVGDDDMGRHWAFIRAAMTSPSRLCIIPLQDVLGLGTDCRMNVPSQSAGNWEWRFLPNSIAEEMTKKLAVLSEITDRNCDLPEAMQERSREEFAA
jgi:4-alpha-glucanotransferase